MDKIFKALADAGRRRLLDALRADDGQSLVELCGCLDVSRQAVSKHLARLEAANLVVSVRRGREKLHYLNPLPIREVVERWTGTFVRPLALPEGVVPRPMPDLPEIRRLGAEAAT